MTNPIPFSGFFHTPTLAELEAKIESLPSKERAQVYTYVMMTLNACHALVEDQLVDALSE